MEDLGNNGSAARPDARSLPAVHRVLSQLSDIDLPRALIVAVVRRHLESARTTLLNEHAAAPLDAAKIIASIREELASLGRQRLQPVINATGIIIHTNLGRSVLSDAAAQALTQVAETYTNLEYDLSTGARGGRAAYLEQILQLLCESEAAIVVNNCAAALVLMLRHFASRPPRTHVIISRGELVQIGGGFRVPEILQASGATLREVGTTNRTTIEDYAGAIDAQTAMLLKVHRSNFYMDGFVASPTTQELAAVARQADVPLVEDLGSGATFDTTTLGGGERETTPAEAISNGADLVCFSGDKLLGGPQAGIIAGRAELVQQLKRDPFFRALRCDKLVLAALEATVNSHLSDCAQDVPTRAMMQTSIVALEQRGAALASALQAAGISAEVGPSAAQVGGGSLPRTTLPSVAVQISSPDPAQLARRLRLGTPAVLAYVADGRVKLDLRTVFPRQDASLIAGIRSAAAANFPAPAR